jgi:hypothetical protein
VSATHFDCMLIIIRNRSKRAITARTMNGVFLPAYSNKKALNGTDMNEPRASEVIETPRAFERSNGSLKQSATIEKADVSAKALPKPYFFDIYSLKFKMNF